MNTQKRSIRVSNLHIQKQHVSGNVSYLLLPFRNVYASCYDSIWLLWIKFPDMKSLCNIPRWHKLFISATLYNLNPTKRIWEGIESLSFSSSNLNCLSIKIHHEIDCSTLSNNHDPPLATPSVPFIFLV